MVIAIRQLAEFRRFKLLFPLAVGPVDQKLPGDRGGYREGSSPSSHGLQATASARGLGEPLRGETYSAHRERAPWIAMHGVKSIPHGATNISGEDSRVERTT